MKYLLCVLFICISSVSAASQFSVHGIYPGMKLRDAQKIIAFENLSSDGDLKLYSTEMKDVSKEGYFTHFVISVRNQEVIKINLIFFGDKTQQSQEMRDRFIANVMNKFGKPQIKDEQQLQTQYYWNVDKNIAEKVYDSYTCKIEINSDFAILSVSKWRGDAYLFVFNKNFCK